MEIGAIDLVTIGEGACLGTKLIIANARVQGNELIIGPVSIGADAYVGTSCVIENDVVIGAGAELKDLTSLQSGKRVGDFEIWDGSPANKTGMVDRAELDEPATASVGRRALQGVLYAIMLLVMSYFNISTIFRVNADADTCRDIDFFITKMKWLSQFI